MKKLLKILFALTCLTVVLLIGGFITLKLMFPPEKIRTLAQNYVKENFQREIVFNDAKITWIGLKLTDFALSENTTFDNGTFIKADHLEANLKILPLLSKKIEISDILIDGLTVSVIKNKDGSFNFDTLTPAVSENTKDQSEQNNKQTVKEEKKDESEFGFDLMAETLSVKGCNFSYQDKQTDMDFSVDNLNLEILNLDLKHPFELILSFSTDYKQQGLANISVPVKIALETDLAGLDMAKASATVKEIYASYKNVKLNISGTIKDFLNPDVDLQGKLSGITHTTFSDFLPEMPHFKVPDILFSTKAKANLEKATADLTQARLSVKNSYISVGGKAGWGKDVTYNLAANINLALAELTGMTNTLDSYAIGGNLKGNLAATQKNDGQDVRGTITLQDLALAYAAIGLSELNGEIHLNSLSDISCNKLTGKLNEGAFTADFSYKTIKDISNIILNLNLDKLSLEKFPASDSAQQNTEENAATVEPAETTKTETSKETFFNIKTNISVGNITIPYFRSDGFTLKTDLSQVSSSMKKTNGQVSFVLKPGAVTNLESFVKENKFIKIIFLPLSIVRKVAGMLNIDLFPAQTEAKKGEISFTNAEGIYSFTNGKMVLDKTVFNSKLTNLNGTGSINFPTDKLDMKVAATLLTSQTPVVIKIGGTISNPSGKLDVVNTVGSLVGGILNYKTPVKAVSSTANLAGEVATGAVTTAGNTVKNTVDAAKDTLKSIGGLFKKKSVSSDPQPEQSEEK